MPEGMCLKSLDGNRQNCDPKNWELISRSLLPGLAKRDYDNAHDDVKPLIMTVTKLADAKNKLSTSQ